MSKITPFLEEVVYVVADFLTSIEHTKEAEKLKKQFELPEWVRKDNPLIKKGLKKVLKDYINENEKVLKYYKNRKPESEAEEESQEEVPTPKPSKKVRKSVSPKQSPLTKPKSPKISTVQALQPAPLKGWMSQFQQPKRLQDLNDIEEQPIQEQLEVIAPKKEKKEKKEKKAKKQVKQETSSQSEQQTPKPKKQKAIKKEKKQKKTKGPVDSSCLNSQEEFELQDKKTKKSVTPQRKKSVDKVEKKKVQAPVKVKQQEPKVEVKKNHVNQVNTYQQNQVYEQNGRNGGPKKFFSRINENEVGHIPENRRDNTFEAKAKYGVGDAWGQYGHEKLKDTRGDSFKKTKGKLKNKAFQGTGININQVNSVPIL